MRLECFTIWRKKIKKIYIEKKKRIIWLRINLTKKIVELEES